MKKMFLFLMMFVMLSGHAYAENVKVGVVDLMKALNESNAGKKAKGELESLIKAKQAVLDQKGKEIEKVKSDLEKQSSVLSPEAKKSREDDLERMLREYQRLVQDSQNEVKKKEGELTGGILKEMRVIIGKMGQEGGYTIILENVEGVVLFSKKEINLTDAVIKKYNESKTKASK
jgi:outer membrane protein